MSGSLHHGCFFSPVRATNTTFPSTGRPGLALPDQVLLHQHFYLLRVFCESLVKIVVLLHGSFLSIGPTGPAPSANENLLSWTVYHLAKALLPAGSRI